MPIRFRTLSSPAVPAHDTLEVPPHAQGPANANANGGRRPSLPFLTVDPHYAIPGPRTSLTSASATDLPLPQSPYARQSNTNVSTRRSSRQSRQSAFAPPWASTLDFTADYQMSRVVNEPEPVVWGGDNSGEGEEGAPVFTNPWGVDGDDVIQPERPHKSDPIRYHFAAAMMSVRMSVFRVKRRWRERRGSA